jgi:hypothetical protein
MEHAQTCPNKSPPDVVAVMTQFLMTKQLASPPDVYSIAVITKSSSTGQISHDKIYYGQIVLQLGKRIAKKFEFTLDKSSPDLNGAQVTRLYIIKEQAFGGGACVCVNNVSTQAPPPKAFGRGACVCHGHLGEELIHVAMRSL